MQTKYRPENRKRNKRRDLRQLVRLIRNAERDAQFYFKHRWTWDQRNGGYDFCRDKFYQARRRIKLCRRHLVRNVERLTEMYAD